MKANVLSKIKKMLTEQRDEILKKFSTYDQDIDVGSDETDYIQAKILSNISSAITAHNKNKLHQIENTFKKISDGSFGICEECEEDISEKRLLVNPCFITCIGCAEKLEFLSKQNKR